MNIQNLSSELDVQSLQETVLSEIDDQTIQELDRLLQEEFLRVLNTGNFKEILEKYGFAGSSCISASLQLDSTKLKSDIESTTSNSGSCNPPSTCACYGIWFNTCIWKWVLCPCP